MLKSLRRTSLHRVVLPPRPPPRQLLPLIYIHLLFSFRSWIGPYQVSVTLMLFLNVYPVMKGEGFPHINETMKIRRPPSRSPHGRHRRIYKCAGLFLIVLAVGSVLK